jgi:FMN-binding domain
VRRAPIVITATVVGLIGVLEFHTRPSAISVATIPAAGAATAGPAAPAPARGGSGTASASKAKAKVKGATSKPASGATPKASSPGTPSSIRTAVGPQVNYNWGVLSVSVTVSGAKITKVGIASLDDGGNPRSQSIDQNSIPLLEQQALAAQSANIQGVSGASYTSAGFKQSLQAALQQLGVG